MNNQAHSEPDATGTTEQRVPQQTWIPTVALGGPEQENARLRLALREAHHRSANQWQLLLGLAELEQRHSPQAIATGCSMRLHTMMSAFATLNRMLNTDTDVLMGSQKVNAASVLGSILVQM